MNLSRDPFGGICRKMGECTFKAFCVDLKTPHFPIMDVFSVIGPGRSQHPPNRLNFAPFALKMPVKSLKLP